MIDFREPVIIKGYCGKVIAYEIRNIGFGVQYCDITLQDLYDRRITIVMEDILIDEIRQNPLP